MVSLAPSPAARGAHVLDVYDDLEIVKLWRDVSNDVEQSWIVANPAQADQAIAAGYLSPAVREEELDALLAGSRRVLTVHKPA